jgi:RHS repeat-associated protein
LGQLVSILHNGVTITFGYDGIGRRVRKTVAGGTTTYLYDGDNLLVELDALGARQVEYAQYPGVDQPHSMRRWSSGTPTNYYYGTDYTGSIVGLIDNNNTLADKYGYSPFGVLTDSVSSVQNTLRYAAREFDGEASLYYDRARYYDPSIGRFISEDPIGLNGGINQYVYVNDNPTNGNDPFGTECHSERVQKAPGGYTQVGNGPRVPVPPIYEDVWVCTGGGAGVPSRGGAGGPGGPGSAQGFGFATAQSVDANLLGYSRGILFSAKGTTQTEGVEPGVLASIGTTTYFLYYGTEPSPWGVNFNTEVGMSFGWRLNAFTYTAGGGPSFPVTPVAPIIPGPYCGYGCGKVGH